MVAANSLRPFQRMHNRVLIYLRLDEWPADVPLPKESVMVETPVIIELHRSWVRIAPERTTQADIENQALGYLLHSLGDAIGIDTPVQTDGQWLVPVILPYAQKRIGQLAFSPSGNLLPAESSSVEEMLSRIDEA